MNQKLKYNNLIEITKKNSTSFSFARIEDPFHIFWIESSLKIEQDDLVKIGDKCILVVESNIVDRGRDKLTNDRYVYDHLRGLPVIIKKGEKLKRWFSKLKGE